MNNQQIATAGTNTTPAVAKKPMDVLKSFLGAASIKEQFQNALADNAPSFVASVIDLFGSDSNLQKCDPGAVISECLKAAVLKLPINKSLGFAYIVPFNNNKKVGDQWVKVMEPTFQIGYKGLIQLAMRTGQYRFINADVVYEGEFRSKNKLTGEFDLSGKALSDTVVGYFAYIETLNGFSKTLYMTKENVIKHAERFSKSYKSQSSPWKTDFDAMSIKTVLRNLLSRYGYLSIELSSALASDKSDETTEDGVIEEINTHAGSQVIDISAEDIPTANAVKADF